VVGLVYMVLLLPFYPAPYLTSASSALLSGFFHKIQLLTTEMSDSDDIRSEYACPTVPGQHNSEYERGSAHRILYARRN